MSAASKVSDMGSLLQIIGATTVAAAAVWGASQAVGSGVSAWKSWQQSTNGDVNANVHGARPNSQVGSQFHHEARTLHGSMWDALMSSLGPGSQGENDEGGSNERSPSHRMPPLFENDSPPRRPCPMHDHSCGSTAAGIDNPTTSASDWRPLGRIEVDTRTSSNVALILEGEEGPNGSFHGVGFRLVEVPVTAIRLSLYSRRGRTMRDLSGDGSHGVNGNLTAGHRELTENQIRAIGYMAN